MRDHLADALDDLMQAQAVAIELGQGYFVTNIAYLLATMQGLDKAQISTIATKNQIHDLALKQASVPGRSELVAPVGTLIDVPLLGPALPGTTPEQTQQVIAFLRRELSQIPEGQAMPWRRRLTEAQILEGDGNLPAAISSYREAATLIEQERRTLPSDTARASFTNDKIQVFDRLVLTLLSQGDYTEAFQWNEQAWARTLTEMLSLAAAQLPTDTERRLYSELTAARAANQTALATGEKNEFQVTVAHYDGVLSRIRHQAPRLLELVDAPPASLERLRELTRSDRFDLVYYLLDNPRLIVWHIGSERMDVRSYYVPTSVLRNIAARLQQSVARRSSIFDAAAARDLYVCLVQPLLTRLDTTRLVLVLPPELEDIPFAALMDPDTGQFLDETLAVSYVPSASILMQLKQGTKLDGAKVLAVAGPRLANAVRDAEAIAKIFPRHEVIPPASATRSTLMKKARKHSVIHLAAHGVYREEDPMTSYIEFQPEPGHDGRLTASDMLALPLDGVMLITVASCTAARVSADSGREIYGITRSLIYAGAQNVLLPLWEVDDEATTLWTTAFYRAAHDAPLADAVRLANVELRQHEVYGADPRFWAAFKLVGH